MNRINRKKSTLQQTCDFILAPLRLSGLIPHEVVEAIGLTSVKTERINVCIAECKGKVLDIGCCENLLVRHWGNGVGIDIYPWKGIDLLCDSARLPFKDGSFDTVTFIASLNHIVKRNEVLQEAYRTLSPSGIVLITSINVFFGYIIHKLAWWSQDLHCRGIKEGESWGFSPAEVKQLVSHAGFKLIKIKRFLYTLNRLYIAKKD
jgi:SAM-dependent methyltransferase